MLYLILYVNDMLTSLEICDFLLGGPYEQQLINPKIDFIPNKEPKKQQVSLALQPFQRSFGHLFW
jgi:hypothetical protein